MLSSTCSYCACAFIAASLAAILAFSAAAAIFSCLAASTDFFLSAMASFFRLQRNRFQELLRLQQGGSCRPSLFSMLPFRFCLGDARLASCDLCLLLSFFHRLGLRLFLPLRPPASLAWG